jgi:hypothetical protein
MSFHTLTGLKGLHTLVVGGDGAQSALDNPHIDLRTAQLWTRPHVCGRDIHSLPAPVLSLGAVCLLVLDSSGLRQAVTYRAA